LKRLPSISVKIVTAHCGVGKTRNLFVEWKKNADVRKLYLSKAHDLLNEHSKRIEGSRHVYGFKWICPRRNLKVIKALLKHKFPHKTICTCCRELKLKPKDCPYHRQFKDMPNTIFAPIEYANTNYIQSSMKPDVIVVDDCLVQKRDLPTIQELRTSLGHLFRLMYKSEEMSSKELSIEEFVRLPDADFESFIEKSTELFERNWLKVNAEEVKNDKVKAKFCFLGYHPSVFVEFRKYYKIYGEIKQYSTPYLFMLFNYVLEHPETKLVTLEALVEGTPNELLLRELAERYSKETGVHIDLDFENIPNPPNAESIIYRVYGKKKALYSNDTVKEHPELQKEIELMCQTILSQRYREVESKPSLITIKACEDKFIKNRFCERLHYGNLRGKNSMESCNPHFVICTYFSNTTNLAEEYDRWFPHRKLTTSEKVETKSHGDYYHFVDPVLDALRWHNQEYEMYQAIMRCRPLNSKREIYVFGNVPEKLLPEEIEVKELQVVDGKIVESKEDWIIKLIEELKAITVSKMVKKIREHLKVSRPTAYALIDKVKTNPHVKFEEGILIWQP
jgi:hypothetical protein